MISQNPSSENLQLILNLFSSGKLKKTLSESNLMLKKFPNSIILLNISGACNAGLLKFDSAIECYKKALEINPNFADAYYNMGIAFKDKGDFKSAIESYEQTLKVDPNYAAAYNNIGNVFLIEGSFDKSAENYRNALKINPNFAEAHNNLGNALKHKGDLESAIDSYQKALKIKPNYSLAYKNIASILKKIVFTSPNSDFQQLISSMIDQKNIVRPIKISQAAISLLKSEPVVKILIKKHFQGELKS